MKRKVTVPAFLIFSFMALFGGTNAIADLPKTRAPLVYYISYTDQYFKDASYSGKLFKKAVPHIVHVGKAVPITHNWGPVRVMRGENQYTGGPKHTLSWDAIRLLSPAELERKTKNIKEGVQRLHGLGVKLVMPYIGAQTMMGDHEKRQGFWKFYDNWDSYAKWLGPKPAEDPFEWLLRDKKGKFMPGVCGGYSPEYLAPLHRYRVCLSNPHWLSFHKRLVRLIAECGYDGVFTDNTTTGGDYCKYCRGKFARWLTANYSEGQLKEMLRAAKVDKFDLMKSPLPIREMNKFRISVIQDYMNELRREGAKVRPGFMIFPNIGNYQRCIPICEACDLFMFESSFTPGISVAGAPPESNDVTVGVAEKVKEPAYGKLALDFSDPATYVELKATFEFPTKCPVRAEQEFKLHITQVGVSKLDADAAEDFHIILTDEQGGPGRRLTLQPYVGVGNPAVIKGALLEPQTLTAKWTPLKPARYRISVGFKYTDTDHRKETFKLPLLRRLRWGQIYQTHVTALSCLSYADARIVFLDYNSGRKGNERSQELGIAQCAAFGRGASFAAKREPLAKYRRFFDSNSRLYEGLVPYGDTGILYAYWGTNPGGVRRLGDLTIADYLSLKHCLYVPLLDKRLDAADLAGLTTVYLVAGHYELSSKQINELRAFTERGGRLVSGAGNILINGKTVRNVLGTAAEPKGIWRKDRIVPWDWDEPYMPSVRIADSAGRLQGLRFAAFIEPKEHPDRLILHAVNYNVTNERKGGVLTPIDNVKISLPLRRGTKADSISAFDPDGVSAPVRDIEHQDNKVAFVIPKVNIYKVIRIKLQPKQAQK